MKSVSFFFVIIVLTCFSCQREVPPAELNNPLVYDIFPVMGQSNAYNGSGLNYLLDHSNYQIKQLGRFGINDHRVIPAVEPLEHFSIAKGCNGFAMPFALLYQQQYLEKGRDILLLPCSENGSSFSNSRWNKRDTLYKDVIERVKFVMEKYPGSKLKGFLWHQGESDMKWGRYYGSLLDNMIGHMRRDIAGAQGDSIPFIAGGLVPYWTDQFTQRKIIDSVISETTTRLPFIGYASSRLPFKISKADNEKDIIHFDAVGQRELGKRYFDAYKKLRR